MTVRVKDVIVKVENMAMGLVWTSSLTSISTSINDHQNYHHDHHLVIIIFNNLIILCTCNLNWNKYFIPCYQCTFSFILLIMHKHPSTWISGATFIHSFIHTFISWGTLWNHSETPPWKSHLGRKVWVTLKFLFLRASLTLHSN